MKRARIPNCKKMSKTKIQIKSLRGTVLFEHETEDNSVLKTVSEANLRGADLHGADLRGAKNLPEHYVKHLFPRHALCVSSPETRTAIS